MSEVSKPEPNGRVLQWLQSLQVHQFSVITLGELRKGLSLLPPGKRRTRLEQSVELYFLRYDVVAMPVTKQIATRWGELIALRQQMGQPMQLADGLIAATALEYDLTLATRNTRDFTALGLRLFSPWLDDTGLDKAQP